MVRVWSCCDGWGGAQCLGSLGRALPCQRQKQSTWRWGRNVTKEVFVPWQVLRFLSSHAEMPRIAVMYESNLEAIQLANNPIANSEDTDERRTGRRICGCKDFILGVFYSRAKNKWSDSGVFFRYRWMDFWFPPVCAHVK